MEHNKIPVGRVSSAKVTNLDMVRSAHQTVPEEEKKQSKYLHKKVESKLFQVVSELMTLWRDPCGRS